MPDPVIVVDYDQNWPKTFELLRRELAEALGDIALGIEHVGSTAVPNLAAKPIIDVTVVVARESEAIERLATLGCVHQGDLGIAGREAFTSIPNRPAHHLYFCYPDSAALRDHVVFRDHLREHPDAVREYAAIKRAAARSFRDDRQAYGNAKAPLIARIMRGAI